MKQANRNKHLTDETRQRRTGSRLMECPFLLRGRCDAKNQRWYLNVLNPEHNHDASDTPAAHPSLRCLDSGQKEEITQLSRVGVPPRTIVTVMQADSAVERPLTVKDV